jgi:predicted GTPase
VLGRPVDAAANADEWERFEDFRNALSRLSIDELRARIDSDLEAIVRVETIKAAVTGKSGAGKSTLINSLRDLRARDQGAALTGTNQTTMEPTLYSFTGFPQVQLWDLPGVGTPDFPPHTYKEKVALASYDFFIIVASDRFMGHDVFLAQLLSELGKPFFFVRSRIDIDVQNNYSDHGTEPQQTIDEIRFQTRRDLTAQGIDPAIPVYLISGRYEYRNKYDFGRLQSDILDALPSSKRTSALVAMRSLSEDVIRKKARLCRTYIETYASVACASAALNPVPLGDIVINFAVIVRATYIFVRVLGLDSPAFASGDVTTAAAFEAGKICLETELTAVAAVGGTAAVTIASASVAMLVAELISPKYWAKQGLQYAALLTVETVGDFIPILGGIASAYAAFYFTKKSLNSIVSQLEAQALELVSSVFADHI